MALKDEIKSARKDLMENGTLKEKISYFFDYYTLHTMVIVIALVCVIAFIHQQVTKPEVILNGILLNAFNYQDDSALEKLEDGFMEYIDLDSEKHDFSINSSFVYNMGGMSQTQYTDYEIAQAIMVQSAAGDVDFISSPLSAILNLGYGGVLVNLENVLSKEEMELYEPYFLYVDQAVITQKDEAIDKNENADSIPCPDPTKPEEMKEPIPVFINVTDSEYMKDIYSYSSDILAFGVAINAPNPERISDFLAYLFQE